MPVANHMLGKHLSEMWPAGTTVGAYAGTVVMGDQGPSGAAISSGSWDGANGFTFSGLTANVVYTAAGVVNGRWRMVRFTALPTATG